MMWTATKKINKNYTLVCSVNIAVFCSGLMYLSLCSHPFKHSQLHTFAGLDGKHTCSRDVPRSIIRFINTEWFKAWIYCHPLKPKLNRIALTESALLLFPGMSLTRSFPFLCCTVCETLKLLWLFRERRGLKFTFESCISAIPERAHGSIPPLWQAAISRADHMTWQ